MTILGLDPGTESCGYGVLCNKSGAAKNPHAGFECVGYGVMKTPRDKNAGERLLLLEKSFAKVLKKYKPDAIGIERLFFFKNQKTIIGVSEARGVLLALIAKNKIPVHEFTPLQMKLAVTGYGRAEKRQVQWMLKELLRLPEIPKPDDAADALGIALSCSLLLQKNIPLS
ncbi:MAG: crossover junction endodeoxyribonuclease RuvC [Candidatus Wildermuthbacteria bacterium]|nr:crossover junction endodeoxyribonuclease RuvC [Candidatus Wildermuthbacteria bacterium]